MVTPAVFAKRVDLSRQRVAQFISEGIFPAAADGRLDEDACLIVYIRWLRGEGRKSAKTAATSRYQDAKMREIELRLAKEAGELIPMEDVLAFMSDAMGVFRSELLGVPAAATRDISLRAIFEAKLGEAVDRIRERFDAGAALIESRLPLLPEDDDGRND